MYLDAAMYKIETLVAALSLSCPHIEGPTAVAIFDSEPHTGECASHRRLEGGLAAFGDGVSYGSTVRQVLLQ